jgi:hypothetical protein
MDKSKARKNKPANDTMLICCVCALTHQLRVCYTIFFANVSIIGNHRWQRMNISEQRYPVSFEVWGM